MVPRQSELSEVSFVVFVTLILIRNINLEFILLGDITTIAI